MYWCVLYAIIIIIIIIAVFSFLRGGGGGGSLGTRPSKGLVPRLGGGGGMCAELLGSAMALVSCLLAGGWFMGI